MDAGARATDLAPLADALAHALMTPARIIAGNVEILRGRPIAKDAQGAGAVDGIAAGSQRLDALVDGLVRFARATRTAGEHEMVDVGAEVRAAIAGLRAQIDDARAEVVVGPLPVVPAEPRTLRIVFRCLLENAVRSRPAGAPRIEISAVQEPGAWRFEVSDDGVGVAEADRARVFDAFARCGDGHPGGLGLGLTLARAIVERHGGAIALGAAACGGTCVHVTLPRRLDESTIGRD
jgi:signal transduction histidine kinase